MMQRPQSVLILAYHYPPSSAAGATRPYHFTKYLQRLGYSVNVITGSPQTSQKPDHVHFVPSVQSSRRTIPGLTEMVLRKYFFPYDDAMLWTVGAYRQARSILQPGMTVISTFPPTNTHLVALALKKRYPGICWIADFRDPLTKNPVRSPGEVRQVDASVWVDRTVERFVFQNADRLIANSDRVAERWQNEYPQWKNKTHHIWNGFDPEELPGPAPIPPRPYKLMAHVGAIFRTRHPGVLLSSLDRLTSKGLLNEATFRLRLTGLIQDGAIKDPALFDRLQKLGCLELVGSVPKEQAVQEIREADYLLLLDVTELEAGQQLPSKIFEYIPIGRPIFCITPKNSPAETILSGSGISCVFISKDTPAEEVDRKFLEFLKLPTEPTQPSAWFQTEFEAPSRVQKLIALLQDCTP